jgi:DNA polymerase III subunit delta
MPLSPDQFVARVAKQPLAPAYLFLGQEGYQRRLCKNALLDRVLPGGLRSDGLTQTDLENTSLREILDDARSLSLFATDRVICIASAELALPRRSTEPAEDAEAPAKPAVSELAAYLAAPTPGTVMVFECSRYDFAGEDRAKLERVQKFYAELPAVEFRHFTQESARSLAQQLAKEHNLRIGGPELAVLLEAVAGDATRLAAEIEKLSLFIGSERAVTAADLRSLVPNTAQSTIFALVNALGKRDRAAALHSLDVLIRDGEYLPLALTFLNTQFRLALAVKEARIASAQQAQNFFAKLNVRMWRERAEQVVATAAAFSRERLAAAVALIYETDKKFREGYKDDRLTMESLVLALTAQ